MWGDKLCGCWLVCALGSESCTALCVATWHVWPGVMSRCGRVHVVYDSRFAWGVSAIHSSFSPSKPPPLSLPSFYTIFLLAPFPIIGCHLSRFPPDPISCFILLLSNYLYLTLPLRTAWPASFLSAFSPIKVSDGQGFHGHFSMDPWTWAKDNLSEAPTQHIHYCCFRSVDPEKICKQEMAVGAFQCTGELCL